MKIQIKLLILLTFYWQFGGFAKTWTVRPDGSTLTLQKTIERAENGDTILVKAGHYTDTTVVINKSLTVIGESGTILDGEGKHQVITVQANNVTLQGLTVRNCGTSFVEDRAGIKVIESAGVRIENCRLEDNFFAIYLAQSQNCVIANNQIHSNAKTEAASGNGVHLWYSKNIEVTGNHISGHRDGMYFEFVRNGRIHDNLSEKNLRYGLHFMFSDSCQYISNIFRRNGAGVAVMYTKYVIMRENLFENNWGSASFGLLLKDITDSDIQRNRFIKNSVGIYAENSSRIVVDNNLFRENGWAIKMLANCMNNTVQHNSFIGNAFDVATNSRNNFSTFSGNYWSNYNGYDLNRDGYGDVPYHPVKLFSLVVEQNPPALVLLRSLFVNLLDVAESVFPVLTPETLVDSQPLMQPVALIEQSAGLPKKGDLK
jgi:nitrous oxidase accessory protein